MHPTQHSTHTARRAPRAAQQTHSGTIACTADDVLEAIARCAANQAIQGLSPKEELIKYIFDNCEDMDAFDSVITTISDALKEPSPPRPILPPQPPNPPMGWPQAFSKTFDSLMLASVLSAALYVVYRLNS